MGFAEYLGVGTRTVSKWEARGADIEPMPELQAVLDTALARADRASAERFRLLIQAGTAARAAAGRRRGTVEKSPSSPAPVAPVSPVTRAVGPGRSVRAARANQNLADAAGRVARTSVRDRTTVPGRIRPRRRPGAPSDLSPVAPVTGPIALGGAGAQSGPGGPGGVAVHDWLTDPLVQLRAVDSVPEGGAPSVAPSLACAPPEGWETSWQEARRQNATEPPGGLLAVGRSDVEAVQETVSFFSRVDQRRGGGHARTAVLQYLTSDVSAFLNGRFTDDSVRRQMFAAAGELACLAGWMSYDDAEHPTAQWAYSIAVKLAAEADDAPLAGFALRAMSRQVLDLGQPERALDLAAASVNGERYRRAVPRERALLCLGQARALAMAGDRQAATVAVKQAEAELASVSASDVEPDRVFFVGEASLAHQSGCVLRDFGDLRGALEAFERAVQIRQRSKFARAHAITLGDLGDVQARLGRHDQAVVTWSQALDAMSGVRSARTRAIARRIRVMTASKPVRVEGSEELAARVEHYLAG
ncbi:tetratricopeptide repeat protein [Kineosporia sp. NBRC 101731]|uniref:tetratricopeptide repeat protein n=1 Tax=Kineosporia sp. NBRC 101731 TaxID=3032199 RepID=UPI0025534FC7|nr:tetratricopeptide repeat protein [Kineosporia sp. NBRC 101731]